MIRKEKIPWGYLIDKPCKFCDGSMVNQGHNNSYTHYVCGKCHATAQDYGFGSELVWERYGEAK